MLGIEKYVGIPYRDFGRDNKGADCLGLIWFVFKDFLDVDLVDLHVGEADIEKAEYDVIRSTAEICNYPILNDPDTWDLVVFRVRNFKYPNHMGIYIGSGRFLHSTEKFNGSCVSELANQYWSRCYTYSINVLKKDNE